LKNRICPMIKWFTHAHSMSKLCYSLVEINVPRDDDDNMNIWLFFNLKIY